MRGRTSFTSSENVIKPSPWRGENISPNVDRPYRTIADRPREFGEGRSLGNGSFGILAETTLNAFTASSLRATSPWSAIRYAFPFGPSAITTAVMVLPIRPAVDSALRYSPSATASQKGQHAFPSPIVPFEGSNE